MDPIVGKILAGWRYDISGLAPEMRGDYESHFAECEHCRSRQRMHRIIDVGLIALASVSGGVFLLAFGVIRHFGPRNAFWLEIAALAGFALSALIWLVVAVATPAPVTVLDAAKEGARRVHDRLPQEIRERVRVACIGCAFPWRWVSSGSSAIASAPCRLSLLRGRAFLGFDDRRFFAAARVASPGGKGSLCCCRRNRWRQESICFCALQRPALPSNS